MTCSTCKHSGPTTVYPKLYCWAYAIYTDKREQCARWEESKEENLCEFCKHVSLSSNRDYLCSLNNNEVVNHDETCVRWEGK